MTKKNTDGKADVKKRGGARPGSGRKAFVPTANERKQVAGMSGYGVPMPQIAALIRGGISWDTLHKYFAKEIIEGKAKANAQIGQTLFQKAKSGDTTAMIFWAKTQMRWRDVNVHDHTSSDGSMTPKAGIDMSKLSDSALAEIIAAAGDDDA